MSKHYEIHTYTLADGYVNCWLDCSDNPITYRTHAAAMRELRDYFADNDEAVLEGEIHDFESDLIIVEVSE